MSRLSDRSRQGKYQESLLSSLRPCRPIHPFIVLLAAISFVHSYGRVPGGKDFVYERDHDAYDRLDDFCSWNQVRLYKYFKSCVIAVNRV